MRTFDRGNFTKRTYYLVAMLTIILGLFAAPASAKPNTVTNRSHADIIHQAVAEGKIAYKLTTPDEFKAIAGQPTKEWKEDDGNIIWMGYPGIRARFFGKPETDIPHSIISVLFEGRRIDIGQNRPIALRCEEDLDKLGSFWGYSGVDLSRLDLSGKGELLKAMPFDSRTVWPAANKLPEGFDPGRVLEEGKNPGLGIRGLHKQGIDGKGISIAIIDQPLVKDHQEYINNIAHLEEIDVKGVPPQMHGPAVASIAVGKDCGVAPSANLYYYAIPMWKWHNCQPYCDVIDKILELNKSLKSPKKIRVVSISTGMFSLWNDFTRWEKTLRKAEQQGVLVITCDTAAIDYGTLTRIPGKDPDEYNNYRSGRNGGGASSLLVPAGNLTTASHEGPEVYTYWTGTGMSWAAPYLAGLATLAFQVDPEIEPKKIVELLLQSAVQTEAGAIVNPTVFIECVRNPDKIPSLLARVANTKSLEGKAVSEAQKDINWKVSQLDINNATSEDVIRIFGKPLSYQQKGQTLKEDDRPDSYIMIYPERFGVLIVDGHVEELRFQQPGYVFRDSITVGSTLEEVLKVLGSQAKIMEGEKVRFERGILYTSEGDKIEPADGVLYKDIAGRKGFCFYEARSNQGVRMLFMNNRVVVLCAIRI